MSSADVVELTPNYRRDLGKDASQLPRAPAPTYRHAAPSAPWPWMDFDMDSSDVQLLPPGRIVTNEEEWARYPQSLFGNWTPDQVKRSKMLLSCNDREPCDVYWVDVLKSGKFDKSQKDRALHVDKGSPSTTTNVLGQSSDTSTGGRQSTSAVCCEHDIGRSPDVRDKFTRYNIEPFFFSSSANWIPSRYQEDPKPQEGDHITVVLPFVRTMKNQRPIERANEISERTISSPDTLPTASEKQSVLKGIYSLSIWFATQRRVRLSRIIPTQSSKERLQIASNPLYKEPETVYTGRKSSTSRKIRRLFSLPSSGMRSMQWDEALEVLYGYINTLESRVLTTNDINYTRELHKLQAHMLYYQQLLQDFRKSVVFVKDTPNPAMNAELAQQQKTTTDLMEKETKNLISEIDRLERQRSTQSDRLKNVMDLAFSTVHIEDSRAMQKLTVATMRDSAAMKQNIDLVSHDDLPSREFYRRLTPTVDCVWHECCGDYSWHQRDPGLTTGKLLLFSLHSEPHRFPSGRTTYRATVRVADVLCIRKDIQGISDKIPQLSPSCPVPGVTSDAYFMQLLFYWVTPAAERDDDNWRDLGKEYDWQDQDCSPLGGDTNHTAGVQEAELRWSPCRSPSTALGRGRCMMVSVRMTLKLLGKYIDAVKHSQEGGWVTWMKLGREPVLDVVATHERREVC
ncbi:hypothetical protein BU15DRAFT_62087 [Melanogaster broomeanus]|nr:hypothetical protein BU15DRAFT_62087 [Melanogaster broomeanus]